MNRCGLRPVAERPAGGQQLFANPRASSSELGTDFKEMLGTLCF